MLYEKTRQKEQEALAASEKSQVLLDLAQTLYGALNTQSLCEKIIIHARDLTNADQASCFLVDHVNKELYSTVFDSSSGKRFSFPMTKGIAGHVATTGTKVNLEDAYTDPRFNQDVRIQTEI